MFIRRKVSSLIKELREDVKEEKGGLVETTGKDFLFVFDLLAQTCGKAATLRVLSFSATSFEDLCQPELKVTKTISLLYFHEGVIEKKEKWIRVTWQPARLESARKQKLEVRFPSVWCEPCRQIRTYIATIFPVGRAGGGEDTWRARQAAAGEAVEFDGLAGGTQEYILTISAIFKDTKLKGTRVRFNLPPYPPQVGPVYTPTRSTLVLQKLSCVAGACEEEPQRGQVEVSWAPPRGDHCKYKLVIAPLKKQLVMEPRLSRTSNSSKTSTKEGEGRTVWLPKGSVSHEARDLDPGEMFLLTLSSMTSSSEECRRPVLQAFLTPPLPPSNVGPPLPTLSRWRWLWRVAASWSPGFLRLLLATPSSPPTGPPSGGAARRSHSGNKSSLGLNPEQIVQIPRKCWSWKRVFLWLGSTCAPLWPLPQAGSHSLQHPFQTGSFAQRAGRWKGASRW